MIYVFGDYELDMDCYELRSAGEPLQIEPKVLDLLAYLVQHHGRFISKEDLYEHLWPEHYVSESALTYCVKAARKAVGDSGRAQQMIKTVHGRGYRFIAPVEIRLRQDADPEAPTSDLPVAVQEPSSDRTDPAPASIFVQAERSLPPPQEAAASERFPIGHSVFQAERRQLTVMWCRVAASPVFSETLDPEDLHEAMQDAHTMCAEAMRRFEGHIAHHFGDGFMVYFGYPRAHEDDAQRAVRTGLEIIRKMARLNEGLKREGDIKLAARLGIHTGMVVMDKARSGTRLEQLALGDTPHVAVQLSSLADPDTLVISPTTLKLIEGYFICQGLGSHVLEDLSQPLVVYQVLQESDAQSRLAAAVTIGLTPFIGRREEVGLLRERWQQSLRGMGQVVLLSGEAGIGKSRLVQVLQERMSGDMHTCIESRCSPYYQNTALYPVVAYMQRSLQWRQDDAPQVKLSRLVDAMQSYDFVLEEAVPLFASLLSLPLCDAYPCLNLTPQQQKQKTLEALLALLLKQAEKQPVCLLMEDLHWADPSTLELLGLLIDQVHVSRMLLLLTFRHDFHPPWAVRSHVTHIALSRLNSRQIERMIKRITRGQALPAEILQQLAIKSDGVPLFVEEMTRMVLESGLVKENDGRYELAGPLTPLAIPSTLHDSLMARLDRLGTGRQIAQWGATLGREFPYALMRAIVPLDEATLRNELRQLVDAELLHQRGFPPQAQYIFKHALVQEAAYASLLRSTKRQYHSRIAEVLEEQFPQVRETQPELLAHHYMQAGLHRQAVSYWQQAGQYAMARSAHLEAIAHFRQALALNAALPDTPERLQFELSLQTALGVALTFTKGYASPEVERAYLRARELCQQAGDASLPATPQCPTSRPICRVCQQAGDASLLFTVLRGLWYSYLVRGELQTACELGEQLLCLAQSRQEPTLFLEAHRALGTSLFFLGELVPAWTHLEQGIALYDAQQHHSLTARYGQDLGVTALGYATWTLGLLGYQDQALHSLHKVQTLAQQLAHPYSLGFALTFAAMFHHWRRETQAVQERVEASITLANEHGFTLLLAMGTTFQGWVLAEQGQGKEGIEQIRRGVAAFQATGAELTRTYMLALLAEAYRKEGRIEKGLRTLAEALALVDKNGEGWWKAELYRLQGELLLLQPVPDVLQAETSLHQALDVARHQQARLLELRATMSLSRLRLQQGKGAEARPLLEEIYAWFTEGLDTPDLKEAKALLAVLRSS